MKIFKVLSNISNIFKYANVFAKAAQGLQIASAAIKTAIDEIKKSNPEFKYIGALNEVVEFIDTVHGALAAFAEIFGVKEIKASVDKKAKDGHESELSKINTELKDLLA